MSDRDRAIVFFFAVGLLASAFNVRWVLQGQERFTPIAGAETLAAAVQLALVLLLVREPGDVIEASAALAAYPLALALLTVLLGGRSLAMPRFGITGLARIRTAAPLGLAIVATAVYYSADSVLLGIFRSTADVGLYSAAYKVVLAALMIPVMVNTMALPMISRLRAVEPSQVPDFLALVSRSLLLVAAPISVGTAITAPLIATALFGEAFRASALPLAILIFTVLTVAANTPFSALLLAEGRDREYLRATLVGLATNLALNLIAIPIAGMLGAALVTIVTEAIVLGLILRTAGRGSALVVARALQALTLPTVALALVALPLRDSFVVFPAAAMAYGFVAIMTGVVPMAEWRRIRIPAAISARVPEGTGEL